MLAVSRRRPVKMNWSRFMHHGRMTNLNDIALRSLRRLTAYYTPIKNIPFGGYKCPNVIYRSAPLQRYGCEVPL